MQSIRPGQIGCDVRILFNLFKMFNNSISDPYEVPLEERRRASTDTCCTVLAALLSLALFATAVAGFDRNSTHDIYFAQFTGGISEKDYSGFKATLLLTFIITVSLGTIWVVLVQFLPSRAPLITYLSGALLALFLAVSAIFVQNTLFESSVLRWVFAGMCGLVACMLLGSVCAHGRELEFQAIILKYAVRFLFEGPYNFLYIPLFLLFYCGLVVLLLFQHMGFSNFAHADGNFFNFLNPGLLGALNIFQFLWGMQFLRDAFTFVISGNAVQWYWSGAYDDEESPSFDRLFAKNWGSVVAGSFANAFLRIPSNLAEQCVCHREGACGQGCGEHCGWCAHLFDLVRTDSYSYINIFGTPYCDAGRECERLCQNSRHFVGFQSAMRNFRMAAGVVLIALALILGYLILRVRVEQLGVWLAIDLVVVIIGSMSFFASIHPSVAEGIQTSFLVEAYLSSGYDYMQKCIPSFRRELQALERRGKDGHAN